MASDNPGGRPDSPGVLNGAYLTRIKLSLEAPEEKLFPVCPTSGGARILWLRPPPAVSSFDLRYCAHISDPPVSLHSQGAHLGNTGSASVPKFLGQIASPSPFAVESNTFTGPGAGTWMSGGVISLPATESEVHFPFFDGATWLWASRFLCWVLSVSSNPGESSWLGAPG